MLIYVGHAGRAAAVGDTFYKARYASGVVFAVFIEGDRGIARPADAHHYRDASGALLDLDLGRYGMAIITRVQGVIEGSAEMHLSLKADIGGGVER